MTRYSSRWGRRRRRVVDWLLGMAAALVITAAIVLTALALADLYARSTA